ncbi:MAG: ChaN family lipoprotein [Desulfocapsa sp.]|nr:ChaN family lipoprotein [Desulfocapsa sp.]
MNIFLKSKPSGIFSLFLSTFCLIILSSSPGLSHSIGRYHLDISFLPEESTLQASATITYPAGEPWQLFTGGLDIHEFILQEEGKEAVTMPLPQGDSIQMYGSKNSQQVTIKYTLLVPPGNGSNLISPQGIVLTSNWHPLPHHYMLFSLKAVLPPGFQGISESDNLPEQSENSTFYTSFSQSVRSITLAAGPYQVEKTEVRKGLTLSTWFFPEEQELSREYLDAAKAYIMRYEKELGPFPYNHYAIVSNRLPTGFGMPTFTLMGQMVLRLPFIKETSLGHEILHSWFGNSIEVAADSGNWCEGLTTYLADYSYAADKGEGAAHRKAGIVNYLSYVHPDSAIALQNFHSASHNQPMAKAIRAVGYNRSAMFFHQLRGLLGPEVFYQGLRDFASSWQGRSASWQDIQTIFETASNQDLTTFFQQQLAGKDMVSLSATGIRTENLQDKSILHFTIKQDSEFPYALQVPILVTTMAGEEIFIYQINEKETDVSLILEEPPLSFQIDPEYDLFRNLSTAELPPVWSRFLGAENKLFIVGGKKTATALAPFITWAEEQGWQVVDDDSVTNQQLSENSLFFLDPDSSSFRSLFGKQPLPLSKEGFNLKVRNNPLNDDQVAVIANSNSSEEVEAAFHKLRHYGKYSSLSFASGRIRHRKITARANGLEYFLESLPSGGSTGTMDSFNQILKRLGQNRVIYLGENHESLADHLLQLRIIQGLHKQGLDLAIAMEMFPKSSQEALDDYVLAQTKMDETEFLRASRWFDVWRYDWRLFRPIFNFCRSKKIPIYGVNIKREIVSTVFNDGNTDGLSEEQKETLAPDRDLALEGYVERLRTVHGFHTEAPHGKEKGIAGFVQSQAIWDESMAENITSILEDNPQKTVIVIAGSQHTRKDSGIPPRVLRRMDVKQASVLNLYTDHAPSVPGQQADYFFMAEPRSLKVKGKIGIMLLPEQDEKEEPRLRISGISHAGKAGAAGIKKDDIIATINGQTVKDMEDIGILMMNSRPGDIVKMTVLRKDEAGELQEKEISVELSDLTKPPMHP